MKKILMFTAAGVTIAVAFTLIGMSVGISQAEAVATLPPACTVEDQELAVFRRVKEIDADIESKIEYLTVLHQKIGYLKSEMQTVKFELQMKDEELLRTSVQLETVKRQLEAARAQGVTNDTKPLTYKRKF